MAEQDTNVVSRLERRLADYMAERRAVKRKAVRELFGPDEDPSTAQMASYNASLQPYFKELLDLQSKIFTNESERRKERTKVLQSMLTAVQGVIRSRATAVTGMQKTRLIEYGRNITNLQKGLELSQEAEGASPFASVGQDKVLKAANAAMLESKGDRYNSIRIGADLAGDLKNPQDREAALQMVGKFLEESGSGKHSIDAIRSGAEDAALAMGLPDQYYASAGADSPQDRSYVEMGHALGSDPASANTMFYMQEDRINNMQASTGGSFGATLAELAGGLSSGDTEEIQEALNDMVGEIGMTPEEAMLHSNQERHKEVLLGQMYNPNADSVVEIARDQLLQDPGFIAYKDSMGFSTDRAAFISLKRQMRKARRKKRKQDRMLLRQQPGVDSPQSLKALKALQENEDKARLGTQAASPSATIVQPVSPASTTVKVGDGSGGQDY